MAIYSCSISNVSRAAGSSACATLSYNTGKPVFEERTGQTYNYGRSERVLLSGTMLPESAPESWHNPANLFNAIENHEKAENARTAKKIMVALPREFSIEQSQKVIERYITANLTSAGYAATYAIHSDPANNNPHAHILVANRQINEKGEWSSKRKMEYALDERGQRIPRLDENGQQKTDKNGRKQWVRINAEQNPLDKKEFLKQLRESWAEECNRELPEELKIDHRSFADQGIDQIPTIHEGYASRGIEASGGVSERAELNREIKKANRWLQQLQQLREQLKEQVEQVKDWTAQRKEQTLGRVRDLLHRGRSAGANTGFRAERERPGEPTETTSREIIRDTRAAISRATAAEENSRTERHNREAEQKRLELERIRKEAERSQREAERSRELEMGDWEPDF